MHTKPKTRALTQTKKAFQWEISSTAVRFMQAGELEAARDGSTNDCSAISPLPLPKDGRPPREERKD